MTTTRAASQWAAQATAEVLTAHREGRPAMPVLTDGRGVGVGDLADDRVVAAIVQHRLVPVLAPRGRPRAPADRDQRARRAHHRVVRSGLATTLDTGRVSEILDGAGVAHLVLKGAALGAVLGHPPGSRGSGDVDVWVRPGDVPRAADALAGAGWPRRPSLADYPRPDDGWRWRLLVWGGKELPYDRPDAATVDLHWRLTNGRRHLSFDVDQACAEAVPVALGDRTVPTLAPAHALEHMAAHGRKEAWPYLRQVVDIVQLAEHLGDGPTRDLAASRREVADAVGIAAYLAPWLDDLVDLDDAARRRCAAAWRGCLKLDRRYHVRMALTGVRGWQATIRHEWWTFRSAPDWRSRFGFDTRVALWSAVRAQRLHDRRR